MSTFEFTSRVRYSEIRPDGGMSLPAIVKRLQDVCVFHAENIGRGPFFWIREKCSWIIVSWQLVIRSMPRFGDNLTTKTWGYSFHAMEGDRNFVITGDDGRIFVEAAARMIYFDLDKQRPVRVPREEMEGYGTHDKLETFEYSPRRIRLPEGPYVPEEPIPIQPMNIDTLGHVNNLVYIEAAMQYLPETFQVSELRVQYLHQVKKGEALCPKRYEDGEHVVIVLENGAGDICSIVEFL